MPRAHLVLALLCALAAPARCEMLVLVNTYPLDPQLSDSSSNFHPQGLGVDETANELLYMQQSSNTIFRTDLTGNIVGSRVIGQIDTQGTSTTGTANHTTDVTSDGTNYYFTDYTCNANCYDLHQIDKTSGTSVHLSTEIAAYGGYPVDVRAGMVYRTNVSTTYNWSNLNQIRVSAVGAVDSTLQTIILAVPLGIGDFTIDLDGSCIWVLEYSASANILRFDLTTGALLDTFALALEGQDAGIAYMNNRLYHYDWVSGSGSTLRVYDVIRGAGVRVVDAVPTEVVTGFGGYPVQVDVENTGTNSLNVTSVDMTFTGTVDRTSEYTVNPDPANPTSIAPGVTESFQFTVDVSVTAALETITIDASFAGTDSVTMGAVVDPDSDVTDTWDVLACGASLCGDCNMDGMVTILDALLGAQHAAALVILTGTAFTNCNVIGIVEPNPGAQVDILDALTLAQSAAALPVILVCC